jgi:subtilisin family serine protease
VTVRGLLPTILGALLALAGCAQPTRPPAVPAQAAGTDRQLLMMLPQKALAHYNPAPAQPLGYQQGTNRNAIARTAKAIARQYGLVLVDDWPMPTLELHCFVVSVPADASAETVLERLGHDPRVEWVQPMHLYRTLARNDRYYSLQTAAQALRLDEVHAIATGRHVRVAEIDSGVDVRHPDLRGQLADAQDFVGPGGQPAEAHGTAVAGVIAAKGDNGIGIVGVAPDATLMALRACWQVDASGATVCSSFTLAKAVQYALRHQAQVLNFSLSGPPDVLLERLLDRALVQGVTIVAAVDPNAGDGGFPASHALVIPVAVQGATGTIPAAAQNAAGANQRMLLAPGHDILTTTAGGGWGFVSGSSLAAAHVSGVAALLLERSPNLKPQQLHALLVRSAVPTGPSGPSALDACAALSQVTPSPGCACCRVTAGKNPRPPAAKRPS